MNPRIIAAGASLGASGVMAGAFATHALKGHLGVEQLGWWQTAVQYQLWHALALLLTAALPLRRPAPVAWLFGLGVVIFSGSLYAMALGAPRWLGAITPIGGLSLIAAWLMLGRAALATPR